MPGAARRTLETPQEVYWSSYNLHLRQSFRKGSSGFTFGWWAGVWGERRAPAPNPPSSDCKEATNLALLLDLGDRCRIDAVVAEVFRRDLAPAAEVVDLEQ